MKTKNDQTWDALGRKLGYVDGVRKAPKRKQAALTDMKAVVLRNSVSGAKVKWMPG
jgi:hypothetical protein